jgi:hypothetical protein
MRDDVCPTNVSREPESAATLQSRRQFIGAVSGSLGAVCLSTPLLSAGGPQTAPATAPSASRYPFGTYRILYNNFASHLLNAYNPNMYYPHLPHRWPDGDWFSLIDMAADFGFNIFQYWLEPRLFCREGLESEAGREFTRQINAIIAHAGKRRIRVHGIIGMATVGANWDTLCPNKPDEWNEVRRLWDEWSKRLNEQHIFGIFPGDPGACSLNGCTAITYIDRSLEIAELVRKNCPDATIEMNMWGPPVFGWGIIQGPPGWKGDFVQSFQGTAWTFDKGRTETTMQHLVTRLPDFPAGTLVSQNMGFNPDGNPAGDQDARAWIREIARTNPVLSWDFSLTEGENAIVPHGRIRRLLAQRRREREVGGYSGGICFTMTPRLNQLSFYAAAQSFVRPDADAMTIIGEFFERMYGPEGRKMAPYMPLFEVVQDWGNYVKVLLTREEYHARMKEFSSLVGDLGAGLRTDAVSYPRPAEWHAEMRFFAELFRDLSGPSPDSGTLKNRYWNHVYSIYDKLPDHVDPRPRTATQALVNTFQPDRWPGRPEPDAAKEWTRG